MPGREKKRVWKAAVLFVAALVCCTAAAAQGSAAARRGQDVSAPQANTGLPAAETGADTLRRRFVHQLGAEFRAAYICPTNDFLRGMNGLGRPMNTSLAAHLRYSLGFQPGTRADRIYKGVYQGIGFAYFNFGNTRELGNPAAVYLFQGARIARLGDRLSLNYEWNLGLSFGWKYYDKETNSLNEMMGSALNAYIDANFYLAWMLTRRLDLTAGVSLTHFSNGNTAIPNTGLNSVGLKVGLTYNFGRETAVIPRHTPLPAFNRHMSYDLTLFGAWRRKGVEFEDKMLAIPGTYTVVGLNFAAMYNLCYKFRVGASLDGVYDGSANIECRYKDEIVQLGQVSELVYTKPPLREQFALGISARAEFVMPYFTLGMGLGVNMLHGGGDMKAFYQMLTLKVAVTRGSYIHVGYCLKDFQYPNYLMLGVGVRFNNKYPRTR